MSDPLSSAKRIVVKIGSSLLVHAETGALKRDWLETLAQDVAALREKSREVILVSSGAIALGRSALGLSGKILKLEESQAAASVGQVRLAQAYTEAFAVRGLAAAQVLLTLDDTEARRRYLNARACLRTLLGLGAIPVINENDTVATAEIRFGDNDRLAARVAAMMEADLLVLLSDVDGLYDCDPQKNAGAKHIADVAAITPAMEKMAGDSRSGMGKGGMQSKLAAAKIATAAGARVMLASGHRMHPLSRTAGGARMTLFRARGNPAAARKRWIAGGLKAEGVLDIDAGAVRALLSGKSLLPAGVTAVEGRFERGDAVTLRAPDGAEIARGLCAYSAEDAKRIMGRRTVEIEALLGYRGRDEMIHRDDLALTVADGTNAAESGEP